MAQFGGGVVEKTIFAVVLAFFFLGAVVTKVDAQAPAPAPAPSNDGYAIDQGIAYVLLFAALVLTYLIHPLDAAFPSFF
ncbi:hypothetical protein R1flu_006296 [Riccia fluitans]|uniref:Uncharacterized protein n=1 Tax=Riccia fluitans TaxID=41844 RepID=A0ABD1YVL8_9MARC